MADNIGYIQPATLAPGKVKEVAAAVESLQKQGAQKLILDLRNCAVGTPQDGIALANLFLAKGEITYLQGQKVPRQDFEADAAKDITKLPLVVITNRGTADGAEIAAGALLDDKRAELVGERTYGDASLRKPVTMEDGGAIILSVAKYYSPSGKAIQDVGVTPETVMSEPETEMELDASTRDPRSARAQAAGRSAAEEGHRNRQRPEDRLAAPECGWYRPPGLSSGIPAFMATAYLGLARGERSFRV